ncbi:hypothetical protein GCM10009616_34350 [Microlunatus lacustris]
MTAPGTKKGSKRGGSGSTDSVNKSTGSGPRTCESKAGKPLPCSSAAGDYYAPRECYAKAAAGEVQDVARPPAGSSVYTCTPVYGGGIPFEITLEDGAAGAPPPPPDPEVLARQAIAQMGLHAIEIGIVPEPRQGRVGIIGMPTWMWVADPGPATTGPISRSATVRGFTVTATAKATRVVWRMGDGTTVSCLGRGTPYKDSDGRRSSPTCGHTYTKAGRYTVQATSYWTVEWEGIAQTGEINLDFTADTAITMGESQVIVRG